MFVLISLMKTEIVGLLNLQTFPLIMESFI